MKRVFGVVLFLSLATSRALTGSAAAAPDELVAIVGVLSGKALAKLDGKQMEVQLFQRLKPGTVVETEAASKIVLIFFEGNRYEFGGMSSGTLGHSGLKRRKGAVRELSPVPVMIEIAPIAKEERPGTRLAGTRIRTEDKPKGSISRLYPSEGAATFARRAILSFGPVDGYEKYKVELEDGTGKTMFAVETASTAVQIPPDVLRQASSYYWQVRTLDREKPTMRGDAVFSTLSEDNERRRAAFKTHLEQSGGRSLLGLMAELDRSLGLHQQACEGLKTALAQSPGNQTIEAALGRFECLGR